MDQVYNTLTALVPAQSAELTEGLHGVRCSAAGTAGLVGSPCCCSSTARRSSDTLVLVFDQAYHVESRNFLMQKLIAIVMLVVVTTSLLVLSTLALGLGSIVTPSTSGPASRAACWRASSAGRSRS